MATKKLTRKQKIFVEEFVATGVGAEAVRRAGYKIGGKGGSKTKELAVATASAIATENLEKPLVQEAVREILTREAVDEAHQSLIDAVRLDYFVFSKKMSDEEITEHLASQGIVTVNIRESDKGKLAFYSLPDGASRGKGIELYHKLHGTFAPEKKLNVNIDLAPNPRLKGLAEKLNEKKRKKTK